MRLLAIATILATTTAANTVLAQDVCDIALNSNAFNVSNKSESLKIAFEVKEELCEKTYESSSDFRNAAKSGGFSLSYAGVGLGASGGQASADGRKSFSSEAFCQAGQEEFALEYEKNQFVSTADSALRAWTKCIDTTKKNSLWLEFKPNQDGTGMTGTIYRTISTGRTSLKITAMQVNPNTAKSDVSCTIESQTVNSDYFESSAIETDTTSEGVECTKPADTTVRVSFGTDGGSLRWVEMPSVEEAEQTSLEELASRVTALQQTMEQTSLNLSQADQAVLTRLSNLDNGLATERGERINTFNSLNGRFGSYIPFGTAVHLKSIEGYLFSHNYHGRDEKDLLIFPNKHANTSWTLEK